MTASRVWERHAWLQGWALFLPAALFLFAFTYYPMLSTVFDSFFSTARPRRPSAFIGLDNYTAMFADPVFREALWNNVIYAVATIPSSIALALLMAVWVNGKMRARPLVRMAYFTPTILPMIAVANIWIFFYAPQIGPLNNLVAWLGFGRRNLLGSPDTALACLALVTVWKEAGFFMIFYLAALQLARKGLFAQTVVHALFHRHRILTQVSGDHVEVIKLIPPLTIGEAEVDRFVAAFIDVMDEAHRGTPLTNSITRDFGRMLVRQTRNQ